MRLLRICTGGAESQKLLSWQCPIDGSGRCTAPAPNKSPVVRYHSVHAQTNTSLVDSLNPVAHGFCSTSRSSDKLVFRDLPRGNAKAFGLSRQMWSPAERKIAHDRSACGLSFSIGEFWLLSGLPRVPNHIQISNCNILQLWTSPCHLPISCCHLDASPKFHL